MKARRRDTAAPLYTFRLSSAVLDRVLEEVEGDRRRVPDYIRAAIHRALHDTSGRYSEWREITLTPRSNSTPEALLEWMLARKPLVSDLCPTGDELNPEVRRVLRKKLSGVQARRVELKLKGLSFEEIATREGCTKQAIHATFGRAMGVLEKDEDFILALCKATNIEDPKPYLEAARGRA